MVWYTLEKEFPQTELINKHIHHLIYLPIFFCFGGNTNSTLSTFQAYYTVISATVTTLYIRCPDLIHLLTESLYRFYQTPFPHPPAPGKHQSILCLSKS